MNILRVTLARNFSHGLDIFESIQYDKFVTGSLSFLCREVIV